MKIAIIDYVLDPAKPGASGLSDVVWNTARELARLGDEVHVVGPYTVDPDPVPGVTVHRFRQPPIGYRNIIGHILIVLRAWRMTRRIPNLDVIYAPEYLTTGIIAPFSRTPVVLRTPGNIYERIATANPFDWYTTQVFKLAARSSARFCRLVIAISHDMGRWWMRTGLPPERLVVIPNGVDSTLFRPAESAVDNDDQRTPFHLLFVGRLSHEKNPSISVDAADELRRQGYDVRLELVGDGPERARIQERVQARGLGDRVVLRGWVPKDALQSLYANADVVVMPSLSEPLGRVMLEAMACGACLVASRVGGIPDHVRDGETGFLVEPGDLQQLVNRLVMLAEERKLARTIGQNARRYAIENLAWSDIGRRISAALEEHVGAGSKASAAVGGGW